MDPTTLMTFLFQTPSEVRSVELLGSWDNFHQPYAMHHDRRRGTGYWSGCFKFDNIIFDGDSSQWVRPRSGGLKQGGTYWYYYRLNDDVEACDDNQAQTSTCPLLPGQPVNIVEVPVELVETPVRSRSASADLTGSLSDRSTAHTWNPQDKFKAPDPPLISRVHGRCISDLDLGTRLTSTDIDPVSPPSISCSRASSLGCQTSGWTPSRDAEAASMERILDDVTSRPVIDIDAAQEHTPTLLASTFERCTMKVMSETTKPGLSTNRTPVSRLDDPPRTCVNLRAADLGHTLEQDARLHGTQSPASPGKGHHVQDFQLQHPLLSNIVNNEKTSEHHSTDTAVDNHTSLEQSCSQAQASQDRCFIDEEAILEEVWSPALSADTASSDGGLNTPDRVADRDLPFSAIHSHRALMDDVSQRLQDIHFHLSPASAHPMPRRAPPPPPPPFDPLLQSYSLPHHATESVHSLGKLSSHTKASRNSDLQQQSERKDFPVPPLLSQPTSSLPLIMTGTNNLGPGFNSLADDIFSELGFPRTSIV
nr:hypothetical protein CFP56_54964 [Quercus suber]